MKEKCHLFSFDIIILRGQEEMARIHRRTVQKSLNDLDNHDGVVTRLEPDILEYEVKWA